MSRHRCTNPKCERETPASRKYCSRRCSAHVRNRRYYLTERGRLNKRAGQSRYFQRHKYELYAKRAARFLRYEQEIIAAMTEEQRLDAISEARIGSRSGLSGTEYLLLNVRNQVRVNHDWHGGLYDGPIGRLICFFINGKPELLNPVTMRIPFHLRNGVGL